MRKPDLSGMGEAWVIDPKTIQRPDSHASVRTWLIKGPWHPWWNHWVVTAVHLRDIPGKLQPPKKRSPDMTHEFLIVALHPGEPKGPWTEYNPDKLPYPLPFLTPIDVCVQFKCESDARACDIVDHAIAAIIRGEASPDQDYRSFWDKVIPATAACKLHPENGEH